MTTCVELDRQGNPVRTIQCKHGCCGTSVSQQCCDYSLSDTVIIVACVVGALLVITIVIVLIICICNNKKQDRIVRIRPPRRSHEHARRRAALPKPPPYSELPPEYTPSIGHVNHMEVSRAGTRESGYSSAQWSQRNTSHSYQPSQSRQPPPPSASVSVSSFENRPLHSQQNDTLNARNHTQQRHSDRRKTKQIPTKIPRRIDTPSTSSTRAASTSTAGRSVTTIESLLPGALATEEENNVSTNRAQREAARSAILQRLQTRQLESPTISCEELE